MTEPAPVLLQMTGISKQFPGVQALQHVDLHVRSGECLALVGENGAGKSTLMKILSGVYAPDEGQIFIDGQPVTPRNPHHAQQLGVSIIYQEFNLFPNMSVEENIFIGREPNRTGFVDRGQLRGSARDKAVTVFESALAGNPEPKAVVCANDDMAFGVSEVAQSQGLSIPIIGFDSLPEALIAINDGTMAATVEQFPGGQSTQAIDILVDFLRNGTTPTEHDTYLTPILITKDNLAAAERAVEAGVGGDATPAA